MGLYAILSSLSSANASRVGSVCSWLQLRSIFCMACIAFIEEIDVRPFSHRSNSVILSRPLQLKV